jgi:hypothetical protein
MSAPAVGNYLLGSALDCVEALGCHIAGCDIFSSATAAAISVSMKPAWTPTTRVRWDRTFATLALSAGEHYMLVSKWLGHSSYVLTLTTYADYIPDDELAAPKLARPVAMPRKKNVVPLERLKSDTA